MNAFIFPGQGSQVVGMGRALYQAFSSARDVFQEVDDTLGQNLSQRIFEGPEDLLNLTENSQPALMAVSIAVMRVLEKEGGFSLSTVARLVAGHSLGEYSALTAVKTLSLSGAAALLRLRGRAMQQAAPVGEGTMAAVLGLRVEQLEEVTRRAEEGNVCVVANDNCSGQAVISGHKDAVTRAMALALAAGAKRCILLKVSAPFHSPLMAPATKVVAEALMDTPFMLPVVPLIQNVTALPEENPQRLRQGLIDQVVGRVRWRETLMEMGRLGITTCIEVGAGTVLSGLARKEIPTVKTYALHTPHDIDVFLTQGIPRP